MKTKGGFLLSKINHINQRLINRLLEAKGIDEFNGSQGRILFVLWRQDNVSIKEIVQETGLAKTTLSSMLNRMEQQGLIIKERNDDDKRSQTIRLSQKSKDLKKAYEEISNEMNAIFYEGFSENEIHDAENYFQRIYENVMKASKKQ